MASYIGTSPANAVNYKSLQVQHFTTSATSTYTLDKSVQGATSIALFINNVRQQPGTGKAYTVSGTTLTLSAATTSSDVMWCLFLDDTLEFSWSFFDSRREDLVNLIEVKDLDDWLTNSFNLQDCIGIMEYATGPETGLMTA